MAYVTIKITKKDYKEICGMEFDNKSIMHRVFGAVKNGTLTDEPTEGQWVEHFKNDNTRDYTYKCSKCGRLKSGNFLDYRYGDSLRVELPKYCDECGDKKSRTIFYV